MADHEIRELERRWRDSGLDSDRVELVKARLRGGVTTQERVELASHWGSEIAEAVLGTTPLRSAFWKVTLNRMERFGAAAGVRAAVAGAWAAVRHGGYTPSPEFERQLEAVVAWLSAPSPETLAACEPIPLATGEADGHVHAITRLGAKPLTDPPHPGGHTHRVLPEKERTTFDEHGHPIDPELPWINMANAVARMTSLSSFKANNTLVGVVETAIGLGGDEDAVLGDLAAELRDWGLGDPDPVRALAERAGVESEEAPVDLAEAERRWRQGGERERQTYFELIGRTRWRGGSTPELDAYRVERLAELAAERAALLEGLRGGGLESPWSEIEQLVRTWYQEPLREGDGDSAEEVFEIELRCETPLPRILRHWLFLLGQRLVRATALPIVPSAELGLDEWYGDAQRIGLVGDDEESWSLFLLLSECWRADPPVGSGFLDPEVELGEVAAPRLSELLLDLVAIRIALTAAYGRVGPLGLLRSEVRGAHTPTRKPRLTRDVELVPTSAGASLAREEETIFVKLGWSTYIATRSAEVWEQVSADASEEDWELGVTDED